MEHEGSCGFCSCFLQFDGSSAGGFAIFGIQPMIAHILVASFYLGTAAVGEGGPTMSNGARYDANGYTAAHRTLPFSTILHVCRGRQCVAVKIVDRGPFVPGRDLDLSVAAAKALHMTGRGVAKVRVSTPLPRPRPDIIDEVAFDSEQRRAMGF